MRVMRRFYIALAAAAALVGCSVEGDYNINIEAHEEFTLVADIDEDATRVAIGGEKYNEVSWVAGDQIALTSEAGVSATLTAQNSGKSDVNFKGMGTPKADRDTYYGIYARSGSYTTSGSTVTLNCAEQWGGGAATAAVLVGMAEDVEAGAIDMKFTPANAIVRVNITNAPTSISKAVFKALDGTQFTTSYSFDIATGDVATTATASEIVVNAPSTSGFFVSLPADLDMGNYAVTLIDGNGNACTKAYAAKKFAKGTTTRVAFEWSTPTVKLGAKSSYTYFNDFGDDTSANSESFLADPAKIFFTTGVNGESCASTYAGVQDAVIEDLGYEIDGIDLSYSAGKVSWDKAANSFVLNAEPSYNRDWGRKTNIKAYIKVGGVKMYSTNVLWITGLPLKSTFINTSSMPAHWSAGGEYTFSGYVLNRGDSTKYLRLKGNSNASKRGYLYSSAFSLPRDINAQVILDYKFYHSTVNSKSTVTIAPSSTSPSNSNSGEYSVTSSAIFGDNFDSFGDITDNMTLTSSTPCVLLTIGLSPGSLSTAFIGVKTMEVRYRK